MIFSKDESTTIVKSTKFDSKKYHEKFIAAIVMHNLSLSFVEYNGIKELFSYLHDDVTSISRNTAR